MLFMENLSNESFFKLVLMFLNWLNVFLKDFDSVVQWRSWIFTCYSIFMKHPNSKWTDTKNFPANFKQDGRFLNANSY